MSFYVKCNNSNNLSLIIRDHPLRIILILLGGATTAFEVWVSGLRTKIYFSNNQILVK